MEGLPCLVSGLRLVWQLTSLPRTRVYFSIKHPFPNGSLTTLETGTTRLLRHRSLKRGKRIVRTTAIEPGVRAPNHLSKTQPNPQSQEPPPDRSNPLIGATRPVVTANWLVKYEPGQFEPSRVTRPNSINSSVLTVFNIFMFPAHGVAHRK